VWHDAFTKEECDAIIQEAELQEFKKGSIGSAETSRIDSDIRDSDITWVEPTRENDWIHKRIATVAGQINFDKYQLDLDVFDGFQYSKYNVDGHYDWHTDIIISPNDPSLHRKLSLSLMLTDPKEYEGGELLLAGGGNNSNPVSLKRNKGDLIAFYSFVPHKVAPVTSGERVALVTWALGPKFR
jgi:PKHD-type hydroxylase